MDSDDKFTKELKLRVNRVESLHPPASSSTPVPQIRVTHPAVTRYLDKTSTAQEVYIWLDSKGFSTKYGAILFVIMYLWAKVEHFASSDILQSFWLISR